MPVDAREADRVALPAQRSVERVLTIALVASAMDAALWLFLYLRPTPFGRPFALDPAHYVFHAMYYGLWAQLILALPFAMATYALYRYGKVRLQPVLTLLQISLTTFLLFVGVVDRECQRFMGTHVSREWLRTYAAVNRTPDVIWNTLASDGGGAWSSVGSLVPVLLFPVLAPAAARLVKGGWATRRLLLAVSVLCLLLPTALWNWIPGGHLRQAKVRPALILTLRALVAEERRPESREDLARAIAVYQSYSRATDTSGGWAFENTEYPLHRHYRGERPQAPSKLPNFIVLQLETFRAKDMKSMNPGMSGPSPTPFLDSLAADSRSAFYRRYYASGVPTVHAFMSIHASVLQHTHKSIPSEATHVNIEGFPLALRRHGYYTMHFTASDPDWDSQRVWLDRWYDEVRFDPKHRELDRELFRDAARRIREAKVSGKPFLAYISSITNHTPFRSPDVALMDHVRSSTIEALHQTMLYTDGVVRELYESLRSEPWFDDTIWIITGDHGYDLGDRGQAGGHSNLRHETTWVPLILHGRDPRLPRGLQDVVASHLDLAPTIAELAYVWDDQSYMGNSLLNRKAGTGVALVLSPSGFAYEEYEQSLFAGSEENVSVYSGSDLTQQREVAAPAAEFVARARRAAKAYERSLIFAIDHDRLLPPPGGDRPVVRVAP